MCKEVQDKISALRVEQARLTGVLDRKVSTANSLLFAGFTVLSLLSAMGAIGSILLRGLSLPSFLMLSVGGYGVYLWRSNEEAQKNVAAQLCEVRTKLKLEEKRLAVDLMRNSS